MAAEEARSMKARNKRRTGIKRKNENKILQRFAGGWRREFVSLSDTTLGGAVLISLVYGNGDRFSRG